LKNCPNWPNPANIYVIPDENGFSLIDVGCGGITGIEHLKEGLRHWKLKIEQLHTVVLSHAHPDHMGAIGWILEEANPTVYIHHLDIGPAHALDQNSVIADNTDIRKSQIPDATYFRIRLAFLDIHKDRIYRVPQRVVGKLRPTDGLNGAVGETDSFGGGAILNIHSDSDGGIPDDTVGYLYVPEVTL